MPKGISNKTGKNPMWGKKQSEESKKKSSQPGIKNAMWGKHHSEETKCKIGKTRQGKKDSEETRKKKSLARMGNKNPNYGKPRSEETKRKLSLAHKGKKLTEEHKKKIVLKSIFQKGEKNPSWKGGLKNSLGYVLILSPDHPYCDSQGYIRRSRKIMESHLGRTLLPTEVVHHINGIKDDDRIENLMLFPNNGKHRKYHYKKGNI